MPSLVIRGNFEVMSVVRGGFNSDAVVKVDVAVREVRILYIERGEISVGEKVARGNEGNKRSKKGTN